MALKEETAGQGEANVKLEIRAAESHCNYEDVIAVKSNISCKLAGFKISVQCFSKSHWRTFCERSQKTRQRYFISLFIVGQHVVEHELLNDVIKEAHYKHIMKCFDIHAHPQIGRHVVENFLGSSSSLVPAAAFEKRKKNTAPEERSAAPHTLQKDSVFTTEPYDLVIGSNLFRNWEYCLAACSDRNVNQNITTENRKERNETHFSLSELGREKYCSRSQMEREDEER